MGKKNPKHMKRVAALGCIVCRNLGYGETPASAHHIRDGQGLSQKADDEETIPLCPPHHQDADGTAKYKGEIAYHRNSPEFERRYGTERELLEQTLTELEQIYGTRTA